jgi:copper chaperone NosL
MTTITRRRFIGLAAGAVAAAPAAWLLLDRPAADAGPPAIRYGRDRCETCGMLISDPRYAAAVRRGQAVSRFDDIGCLVRRSGLAVAAGEAQGFVHDAASEAWLDARGAAYVRASALRTPMNSGLAAYAAPARAVEAHPGAAVLDFTALAGVLAREGH